VTRRWVKLPVENRTDWENMKQRYDANEPSRLPADAIERGKRLKERSWPIVIKFAGPFWQIREWVGFEGLCMMIYDDPELISEMCSFWEAHVMRLMERVFEHVIPDEIYISEDMAYKSFPMVSPEHVKQFFLPVWAKWGEYLKSKGVKIYAMDSDGNVDLLIPYWIEAGFNVCDPIEVAAGNDIVEFRKKYGTKMAYRGGVDKREIAKGGEAIEKEIERLMPVIISGGFIPGCDHAVPHDISWSNFVYYTKLLAKATGWL
jgi:uroporphyrinogen decarboxylase